MPTKPMNQRERILRNIAKAESGCWEWTATKDGVGYGRLKVSLGSREEFRHTSAHRHAYSVFVGPVPDDLCVLHKCDNRACVNPDHLFLGTQRDNMLDMHAKGRGPKGYKRNSEACRRNAQLPRKRTAIDAALSLKPSTGEG